MLAGFVLGLATLTRPVTLLFPVVLLAWILATVESARKVKALKTLGVVTIMMVMTILPWTIRNYVVTGSFVLVTSTDGLNFYIGHNPRANGDWVYMGDNDPVVSTLDPKAHKEGFRLGFQYLLSHPREEWNLFKIKQARFWGESSNWFIQVYAWEHRIPWIKPPTWAILAWIGTIVGLNRWHGSLLVVMFVLYYNALIVAVYYAPRYRLVVEPFWIILAVGGVAVALDRLGNLLAIKRNSG